MEIHLRFDFKKRRRIMMNEKKLVVRFSTVHGRVLPYRKYVGTLVVEGNDVFDASRAITREIRPLIAPYYDDSEDAIRLVASLRVSGYVQRRHTEIEFETNLYQFAGNLKDSFTQIVQEQIFPALTAGRETERYWYVNSPGDIAAERLALEKDDMKYVIHFGVQERDGNEYYIGAIWYSNTIGASMAVQGIIPELETRLAKFRPRTRQSLRTLKVGVCVTPNGNSDPEKEVEIQTYEFPLCSTRGRLGTTLFGLMQEYQGPMGHSRLNTTL
jgi:hypothetical protein